MAKKRKWPTVPEILRVAAVIIDRPEGSTWYRVTEDGPLIAVHRATRPNLLKSLGGWLKNTNTWNGATYYRRLVKPGVPPDIDPTPLAVDDEGDPDDGQHI